MMKAILKKCIILFVLILGFARLGVADSYGPYIIYSGENLGFQVVDGLTGESLSNVAIEYTAGSGFISESGRFYIIGSDAGTYVCTVKKLGYWTESFIIQVILPPSLFRFSNSGLIKIKLMPSGFSFVEEGGVPGYSITMVYNLNLEAVLKED